MLIEHKEVAGHEAAHLQETVESHFIELKSKNTKPAKLTTVVSALANTNGGEILVGIEDDTRSWSGFQAPEAANGLLAALNAMTPLGDHADIEFLHGENLDGYVVRITVHKVGRVLESSDGGVYVRRGAQTMKLDEAGVKALEFSKGVYSFEDQPVATANLDEIVASATTVDFMAQVVPAADPAQWIGKQKLVVEGRPCVACVLLFSDEPQADLPKRSAIKILRYKTDRGGSRDQLAFDPLTIEGSANILITSAVSKAKELVEEIRRLGAVGLESIEYPEVALHEVITNAVLHRDYSIPADIRVSIFDNRIVIESPGRLPGHITVRNLLDEQFARNPKLVRLINKFPNPPNKDVGEGLNTAFEAMARLRLKRPMIEEAEEYVRVTLLHEKLASPEELVMEYLDTNEEITNSIARHLTGIQSENSMKEVFYRLRQRGMLEQVPGKKARASAWRKPVNPQPPGNPDT